MMTSLTDLNVSSCPKMTSQTVSVIARALGASLASLNIRGSKCMDTNALIDISTNLHKLVTLYVTMCKHLRPESFRAIHRLVSLRQLTLHGCDKIGPEPLLQMSRALTNLEML